MFLKACPRLYWPLDLAIYLILNDGKEPAILLFRFKRHSLQEMLVFLTHRQALLLQGLAGYSEDSRDP